MPLRAENGGEVRTRRAKQCYKTRGNQCITHDPFLISVRIKLLIPYELEVLMSPFASVLMILMIIFKLG